MNVLSAVSPTGWGLIALAALLGFFVHNIFGRRKR